MGVGGKDKLDGGTRELSTNVTAHVVTKRGVSSSWARSLPISFTSATTLKVDIEQ